MIEAWPAQILLLLNWCDVNLCLIHVSVVVGCDVHNAMFVITISSGKYDFLNLAMGNAFCSLYIISYFDSILVLNDACT